jgi:putative hydrolase of the HAD superfamily
MECGLIKAVVFDYGKVISFPPDPKIMERLASMAGVAAGVFEPLLWGLRGEYDRGTINAREYYGRLLSRLNVRLDEKTIEAMIELDWKSWKNLNPGTVKLMEDVKAAGFILGILSNMPHDFLAFARKKFPLFSLPDVALFSCEVNLIKPEAAIYQKLLSLLKCAPGELVFFDDTRNNVESAAALGIRAFLWKDPETARRDLSALGAGL